MIQYFYNNQEYTTRYKLANIFNISQKGGILQEILANPALTRIQERNQYYFLKSEVEVLLEQAITCKKK